ncbi:TetR/AcrR family transcriptional regulator [Aliisedimentitalea scapharcae]|uniref:TetR/AcrR family transcriptional regulator n=1 Tax=Aliisedimentitalea scapharcae TaxID=1524259 RepID=A0ABZ2XSE9_9RHOB
MKNQDVTKLRGSEVLWLNAACELLTEAGVEAVKVMPLAKRLGVSRTSFYWHFRDRDALLEALFQRWEQKNTGNLVARTQAPADNICEAVFNLFDCWLDDTLFDARLDLAIRNWARNDKDMQQRLDRSDDQRKQALVDMFVRHGFDPRDAEVRTMTAIYVQIGYISMQVRESFEYRIGLMPDYVTVFTGQSPAKQDIAKFMARHER